MTKYLSDKIKTTSFILMIMVVVLHSYNLDTVVKGTNSLTLRDYNWFVQNFLSYGITRIAVPLFFLISGYLFLLDGNSSRAGFISKIRKRIRTLVVPFFIWTLYGVIFYLCLQSIPQLQQFFSKKLVVNYTFTDWFTALISNPIPYQLWFLRDLILLCFISPLIYYVVKYFGIGYILIVFVFWVQGLDSIFLTSEAIMFFSIGLYIKQQEIDISSHKCRGVFYYLILWMFLLILKQTFLYYDKMVVAAYLHKISILAGLVAYWKLYDRLSKEKFAMMNTILKYSGYSFFIYVFHEPLLTVIKKGMLFLLGTTPPSLLAVYILSAITTVVICILVSKALKIMFSSFYNIITGAR